MRETMKAIVFKGVGDLEVQEFPVPAIPPDKVLIRIEASAICTWEQRVYSGVKSVEFPFVGGHEMAGTIIGLGDEVDRRSWKEGDTVTVGVTLPCKQCYQCKSGNEQNCEYFNHTQHIEGLPYMGMGGLCSHIVAHPSNLFRYWGVTPEEATLTEPLSCVVHSIETGCLQFGDVVMVIGCGTMGMLHIMLAQRRGACVIATDVLDERLAVARRLGAKFTLNPQKDQMLKSVLEYTDGVKLQAVFDTTPVAKVAEDALKYLGNKGRLVLYSSFYPDEPIFMSPDWMHKSGAGIVGTANSNTQDFMKAARLISFGAVDVRDLISETYGVEEAEKALDSACKGDKFRVVIKF